MAPKSRPKGYLTTKAYDDLKRLPGNIRRQMILAVDGLEVNLRPANSKHLDIEKDDREVRRLRLGKWRILYLISDETPIIFGFRQRPPYDYQDLQELIKEIE
jgi:mRNA-degrading endonuclease RelE of RelBE toxin-antitoxin system